MLFQVVHTHTAENCPGRSAEQTKRLGEWWQSLKNTAGIKVLAGYVSPMDHTFHITVEANDYPTLAKALGALNSYGTGHTSPVLTMDTLLPLAEAGAFRTNG
ncbi:MAG TPA: DUF3303 family protein [Dehalococcoidales bacterium]